ncbi:hypothetical protein MVES1_001050 [Malassezia vespertilionis]|uniref:Uncharacterized protein n=1 Tax=Malassezia vespertilionis TaxID=2020962 RepID=A0A2N1JEV1_9BASI|nr:uncharacterized protein MVES1_001050 [Malassezia vespertilionis]PKI85055.1 hypothetical protein MVES_000990 [Malassezia vespertilionis]WFD05717.1 hypothetical protein MVES1_001050 [Malassezia vespertilionis]
MAPSKLQHTPSKDGLKNDKTQWARAPGLEVDANLANLQVDGIHEGFLEVLRQTGWLLQRRAQLVRHGRGTRELVPTLHALSCACKNYVNRTTALRDHLLCAEARLEYALERKKETGIVPSSELAEEAPPGSLEKLDPELYNVISSMPLDWSAETENTADAPQAPDPNVPKPSGDASNAIVIDSDDESSEPQGGRRARDKAHSGQPTKRRKMEAPNDDIVSMLVNSFHQGEGASPAAPALSKPTDSTGTSADLGSKIDQLISDNVSDLSWLGMDNLQGESKDAADLSDILYKDTQSMDGVDPMGSTLDFSGLSALDFPADTNFADFDLSTPVETDQGGAV